MSRTEVIERLGTFGLFHVSIAYSAVIPEIQEFLVDLSPSLPEQLLCCPQVLLLLQNRSKTGFIRGVRRASLSRSTYLLLDKTLLLLYLFLRIVQID
jgi:hypothetical protein